jgi:putative SOS response-associated peptidase YedK
LIIDPLLFITGVDAFHKKNPGTTGGARLAVRWLPVCGRFTLHTPEPLLRDVFGVVHSAPLELTPRHNIAPSQQVPIIRDTENGRQMVMARWGMVPHWSQELKIKYSTINARIESVAERPERPAYCTPFKHRRCLIPADGFYE